jgi:O-antigen/teichoic acid export membrane protein
VGAAMRATGQYWRSVATTTTMRMADAVALVAVAASGQGFVAAAGTMLIARVALLLGSSLRFYSKHPAFRPGVQRADLSLAREMLAPSLSYMSLNAGLALNVQGSNLVVGAVLGPTAVVAVTAIRTLTRLGRIAAAVAINALEPILAELAGRGAHKAGKAVSGYLLMAAIVGSVAFAAGMTVVGEPFLVWWTHGVAAGNGPLFLLMVLAVSLEVIWYAWQTPYAATNRHGQFAGWSLALAMLSLPLLAVGLEWLGIAAAGLVAFFNSAAMLLATGVIASRIASVQASSFSGRLA